MIWNSKQNMKYGNICKLLKTSYLFNKNEDKTCEFLGKLFIFLITCCKRIHSKSSFYEKYKMSTKTFAALRSFVIVGSFDCYFAHI
jgi:hypothetical protein